MLLQMHGLLVFGVLVSTLRYAQFYLDLNAELHREHEPDMADARSASYLARQNEPGGCVRGGRDGFGVTLLCMEGEREDLVVERL